MRISRHQVMEAGFAAAVAALILELLMSAFLTQPAFGSLRLTAALVMGQEALPPFPLAPRTVFLGAPLYFLISGGMAAIYALILAPLAQRMTAALFLGALYGTSLYFLGFHALDSVYPWLQAARGWTTVAAHLVFGLMMGFMLLPHRVEDADSEKMIAA